MSYNAPPHLELNTPDYPNLDPSAPSNRSTSTNANSTAQNMQYNMQSMKDNAMNSKDSIHGAQSTMDSIRNNPTTQNIKNTLNDGEIDQPQPHTHSILTLLGPVIENVRNQAAKTSDEFSALANSRTKPDQQTATGQELTQYHSMFYSLLSWENPRATALTYAATILSIFLFRYLPIVRYFFKFMAYALGATAGAEIVGRAIFNNGFASQMRPRKYYVVPRESLERMTGDFEQLVNFFVIEFQRVLFAENIYATIAAFLTCFVGYWLVKFVPLWGLSIIGTTVIYFAPLIYFQNKETIDAQLNRATEAISQQTHQIKDMTAQQAQRATEVASKYAHDYSAKAQELIGSASRRASASTGGRTAGSGSSAGGRTASSTHQQSTGSQGQPSDNTMSGHSETSPSQQQSSEANVQSTNPFMGGRNETSSTHQNYQSEGRPSNPFLSQANFPVAPTSEPAPLHQSLESEVRREDPLLNA